MIMILHCLMMTFSYSYCASFFVSFEKISEDCWKEPVSVGCNGSREFPFRSLQQALLAADYTAVATNISIFILDEEIHFSEENALNLSVKESCTVDIFSEGRTKMFIEESLSGICLRGNFRWTNFTWLIANQRANAGKIREWLFRIENSSYLELISCSFETSTNYLALFLLRPNSRTTLKNSTFSSTNASFDSFNYANTSNFQDSYIPSKVFALQDEALLSLESVELVGIETSVLLLLLNSNRIFIRSLKLYACVVRETLIAVEGESSLNISHLKLEKNLIWSVLRASGSRNSVFFANVLIRKLFVQEALFSSQGDSNQFSFKRVKIYAHLQSQVSRIVIMEAESTIIDLEEFEFDGRYPGPSLENKFGALISLKGGSKASVTKAKLSCMSCMGAGSSAPIVNRGFNLTVRDSAFFGFPRIFAFEQGSLEVHNLLVGSEIPKVAIASPDKGAMSAFPLSELSEGESALSRFFIRYLSNKQFSKAEANRDCREQGQFSIGFLDPEQTVKLVAPSSEAPGIGSARNIINLAVKRSMFPQNTCLVAFDKRTLNCKFSLVGTPAFLSFATDKGDRFRLFFKEHDTIFCLTDAKQELRPNEGFFPEELVELSTSLFISLDITLRLRFRSCSSDSMAMTTANDYAVCRACENYFSLTASETCEVKSSSDSLRYYSHNQTAPDPGFWRLDKAGSCAGSSAASCLRRDSCLGDSTYLFYNDIISLFAPLEDLPVKVYCGGECSIGYQGFFCASCSPDYGFINRRFTCISCPKAVALMVLCFVTRLGVLGFLTSTGLKIVSYRGGAAGLAHPTSELLSYEEKQFRLLLLLFDHLQVVQILFESAVFFPLKAPFVEEITSFFLYSLGPELDQLYLLRNCLQQRDNAGVFWFVFLFVVPLVVMAYVCYFWAQRKYSLRQVFLSFFGISLVDLLRPLVERLFCVSVDDSLRSVKELDLKCSSKEFIVSAAISSVFIAVVLPPVLCLLREKQPGTKNFLAAALQYVKTNLSLIRRIALMIMSCLLVNIKLSGYESAVPAWVTILCALHLLAVKNKAKPCEFAEESFSLGILLISSGLSGSHHRESSFQSWEKDFFLAFLILNWLVIVLFVLKILTFFLKERTLFLHRNTRNSARGSSLKRGSSQLKISQAEQSFSNSEAEKKMVAKSKHRLTEEFSGIKLQVNPLVQGEVHINLEDKSETSFSRRSADSAKHKVPWKINDKEDPDWDLIVGKLSGEVAELQGAVDRLTKGLRLLTKQNKRLRREIARLNGGQKEPMNSASFDAEKRGPSMTLRPLEMFHKDQRALSADLAIQSVEENKRYNNIFLSRKSDVSLDAGPEVGLSVLVLKKEMCLDPVCLTLDICVINRKNENAVAIDSIKLKSKTPELNFILDKKPRGGYRIEPNRELTIGLLVRYQTSITYFLRDPGIIELNLTGRNWHREHRFQVFWWDFLEEAAPSPRDQPFDLSAFLGNQLAENLGRKPFTYEEIVCELESMFHCIAVAHVLEDVDEIVLTLLLQKPKALIIDHSLIEDVNQLKGSDEEECGQRNKASFVLSRLSIPMDEIETRVVVAVLKDRVMIGFRVDEPQLKKAESLGYIHGRDLRLLLNLYARRFYFNLLGDISAGE